MFAKNIIFLEQSKPTDEELTYPVCLQRLNRISDRYKCTRNKSNIDVVNMVLELKMNLRNPVHDNSHIIQRSSFIKLVSATND